MQPYRVSTTFYYLKICLASVSSKGPGVKICNKRKKSLGYMLFSIRICYFILLLILKEKLHIYTSSVTFYFLWVCIFVPDSVGQLSQQLSKGDAAIMNLSGL